ncbi:hypothetical protein FDC35_03800 [Clostridium botulinum]|nr:hypothetical protein [Clostridium botulinum]NFP00036.1 hypothetical protein [Clostridium botulinum]
MVFLAYRKIKYERKVILMTTYSPFELEPIFIDFKNESYNLGLDIQANQNDTLTLNFICRNNGIEEDMSKYKVELRVHNNNTNTDYIQTQNENVTLGTDGSVKIVCQSLKGNKLTAYSGQLNGVLRIFNTENKQKATRIITMRIIADPLETDRANICESTITKLEDLDWILNEAYNIEDEFKKAIEEAIKQKAELTAKISESVTAKNNLNSTIQTANNTNNTLNATNTTAINTKNELNTLNTTAINTKSNLDKSNTTALGTNKTLTDTNTTAINTNNTLNATINNANNSKTALDTSKNNADKSKSALDSSVITGNTLKTNLDNSISTGTTLKNDIDNRITTGNKLKTDIDNSSTIATSKKEQLDTANVQAEKNIETLNSFGDASQLTKDVTTLKTKVLENTLTSIETDSTLTKLDNSENGFVRNMLLKGRTLQNVIPQGFNSYKKVDPSLSVSSGTLTMVGNNSWPTIYYKDFIFKPNTIYTLRVMVNELNINNYDDWQLFRVGDGTNENAIYVQKPTTTGLFVTKFTTASWVSNADTYLRDKATNNNKIVLSNLLILEGDWTGKEIPPYFDGIKSVGELEGNKISILTCGKNFAKIQNDIEIKNGIEGGKNNSCSLKEGLYYVNAYDMNNNNVLSPNIAINFYEGSKQGEAWIPIAGKNQPINLKQISNNFRIFWNTNAPNATISKISITKNPISSFNEYEEYKEDKTEILVGNEPLRGLPNGVVDVIDVDKNERTKNVAKDLFVGNDKENWSKNQTQNNNTVIFAISTEFSSLRNSFSNKFVYEQNFNTGSEHFYIDDSKIIMEILKSRLETPDVVGLKKLLKTWADAGTPLEVYYQLATPVVEKLSIKDTLQTFQDGYIQLNNAITPCTQLEYSTNLPSAIGGLTQIADKLVDDVTNVEITISDMDAEIGEARKDKNTLNERLEDDRTNILNTIGQVDITKDGDIALQLKERMKDIISITKNIKGKTIKIIGDSITAGVGGTGYNCDGDIIYGLYRVNTSGHCWANTLKLYLTSTFQCTVNNFGISGLKSTDMVEHLSDLIKDDDEIVLCSIGTNNRKFTGGDTQLISDIKTIYNYVSSLNKEIIFISPISASANDDKSRVFSCDKIENSIMIACGDLGIEYISCYKEIEEYCYTAGINVENLLCDGLHPSDKGYDILYKIISNKLGIGITRINNSENWANIPCTNGLAYSGYEPQYIVKNGICYLGGSFTGISENGVELGILPSGYAPKKNCYYMVQLNQNFPQFATVGISTGGNIYFRVANKTILTEDAIHLESISFPLD